MKPLLGLLAVIVLGVVGWMYLGGQGDESVATTVEEVTEETVEATEEATEAATDAATDAAAPAASACAPAVSPAAAAGKPCRRCSPLSPPLLLPMIPL